MMTQDHADILTSLNVSKPNESKQMAPLVVAIAKHDLNQIMCLCRQLSNSGDPYARWCRKGGAVRRHPIWIEANEEWRFELGAGAVGNLYEC